MFQNGFWNSYASHQNFPFLVIVGPIIAYISHQNCEKRKFCSKMVFGTVVPAIKNFLFWQLWVHNCLCQPSKFPKKEIHFLKGHCQPHIKLFPFLDCGSTFLFRNFLFWKVTASLILSSFLFGNIT